ncbi:MAG: hypothetical protein ACI4S4_02805 [Candidatus Ornithospirochaeta sp.]
MEELIARVSALVDRVGMAFPIQRWEIRTEHSITSDRLFRPFSRQRENGRVRDVEERLLSLPFVSQVCIIPSFEKRGMRAVVCLCDTEEIGKACMILSQIVEKENLNLANRHKIAFISISDFSLPTARNGRINRRKVLFMYRKK